MNHIQLTIQVPAEMQDELVAQLSIVDAVGFEQTETELLVYFEEDNFNSYDVNELLQGLEFHISTVVEKNWNEAWEQGFEPVVLPGFCAVRAHFHKPIENVKHEIIVTPKMSFGTGHHATTYLMLQQMQNINFLNKTVLDFGTGTGILAIMAKKQGAKKIVAIDHDEWSINNAKENFIANDCTDIHLLQRDNLNGLEKYDIILANINLNVILSCVQQFKLVSHTSSLFLLSGFLVPDEKTIVDNFTSEGFKH